MDELTPEYGIQIAKAFEAINQLHWDVSKLLTECDNKFAKRSIFNVVAKDLSKSLNQPDGWMPYSLFRYFDASNETAGLVEGVLVWFWEAPSHPEEPMFVVGQIKYLLDVNETIDSACDCWDLWRAVVTWVKDPPIQQVIKLKNVAEGRVEWIKMMLIPLFSIRSIQDVENTLAILRNTSLENEVSQS